MFIVKQHLVPPETLKTAAQANFTFYRSSVTVQGGKADPPKSQSIVEHQFTDNNQACVKFNVVIEQVGQNKGKAKRVI